MNPKPFASLNHFTVPVATDKTPPTNWGNPPLLRPPHRRPARPLWSGFRLHLNSPQGYEKRLAGYKKSRREISCGVNTQLGVSDNRQATTGVSANPAPM